MTAFSESRDRRHPPKLVPEAFRMDLLSPESGVLSSVKASYEGRLLNDPTTKNRNGEIERYK